MPKILRTLLVLFCLQILATANSLFGQNLIPNPSFELTNNCPSTYNQWSALQSWQAGSSSTPDYYNCGFYGLSIKGNPSNGSGVLGFWGGPVHPVCPTSAYVENVSTSLQSSMTTGQTYEVSFDVQIDGQGFGSATPNDCVQVGAYFYESGQAPDLSGPCSPAVTPQVFVLGSQVQKGTYTRFTFTLTATANWDNVLWGTFASAQTATASCSSYAGNKMYFNLDQLSVTHSQVLVSQILAFDGEQKGQKIELGWQVSDPHLMDKMVLEHKQGDAKDFTPLAEIPAFSEQEQYQYLVENPSSGLTQYRLQVQTKDQGILLSEVLPFNLSLPDDIRLFPNPGRNQLCTALGLKNDEFVTIAVKDIQGRTIWTRRESLLAGEHQLKLATQNWASGLYFLDICTDSGRFNAKEKWVKE
ncbi:MAG: T9SS type A sorting domain-containing protein [Bacteroidia bacterium]